MNKFVTLVATAGYVGFSPVAPGTAGALVGVLFCLLFSDYSPAVYLLTTAALFFLGAWAAGKAEILLGRKDSPRIVIDEVVGCLFTMILVPFSAATAFLGFFSFRLFDILKPPPAGAIDRRMSGGFAIVLDDAVAGIYANFTLHLLLWTQPHFFQDLNKWIYSFL